MSIRAALDGFVYRIGKTERNMAESLANPPRHTGTLDMERFTKKVRVKAWDVKGFYGITLNGSYPGRCHILLLPGGAYALEAGNHYRKIAERFAISNHMKVSIFQYPLCPEYTAADVRIILMEAYRHLIHEYPEDVFFLLGDFSGGGLALAFLQELKAKGGLLLPKKVAVISPWLDISLSNPKIKIVRKKDPVLPLEALINTGRRYRGSLDAEDPFVSPLYGKLEGLGQVLMFSSENEILTPDCELFTEGAEKAAGTKLIYRKAAGMFHDFIYMPCRESDEALAMISEFFQGEEGKEAQLEAEKE